MGYHDQNDELKKRGTARLIMRVVSILILVGAVASVAVYRNAIWTRLNKILALGKDEEPIPVLSLERGPLVLDVLADGEIVGLGSVPVATPTTSAGSLKLAWLINEGTLVNKGDALIRYDNTNTQLDLESQNNSLDSNGLNAKIQTGTQQFNEKSMKIDRTTAEMDYEYTKTVQPEDETIFSKWEIITAQLNADFAKSKIENLAAKAKVQTRINRSQAQQTTIQRNRSLTEKSLTEQALSVMDTAAPAAGLVVYHRNNRQDPKIGDNCQAGQVMIDLVDLNALQARLYVLEKEAGSLAKGKAVTVRLDALPDKDLHGEVVSVTSIAASLERNSPLKYFTADVTIKDAGPYLRQIKPGMALRANVILEKYDSCFMVPSSAIDFKNDQALVYIKMGNGYEKRNVKIGMGKHGQATILSGVNEKELIALRNPFEEKKLKLPDFSKASASNQQRGRGAGGPGGPGGMQQMQGGGGYGGGGGGYGGGGGGGGGGRGGR